MVSPRIKSCFVSATSNAKTHHIRNVLSRRGVRIVDFEDVAIGHNIIEQAVNMIRRADLFIAVLTNESFDPRVSRDNVLFELGIAVGCGKQILIFAPPRGDALPVEAQGMLTVRTSLSNHDAIEFALDQVLAAPERKTVSEFTQQISSQDQGLGPRANELLASYSNIIANQDAHALEKLVGQAIGASGVDVISESFGENTPIDLAVWADGFQSTVGNPLLIEVKLRLSHVYHFKRAVKKLARSAQDAGSLWSLLVYGDGPNTVGQWAPPPTVLVISARELLAAMRTTSFVDVVRDLRNRRVHGGY